MIKTKSVHSPIDRTRDGLRLLVARYRGRGLKASRYDVWMANLGPSEALLAEVQGGAIDWGEFRRRYAKELLSDTGEDGNRTIKNRGQKFTLRLIEKLGRTGDVTLLCHCGEDEMRCHRHVLKAMLEKGV
jgi:uncharacterized protein YeaO (DUF488 family)